jgi:hypothetical protein
VKCKESEADLHDLVPTAGDNDGVDGVRAEADARYPKHDSNMRISSTFER